MTNEMSSCATEKSSLQPYPFQVSLVYRYSSETYRRRNMMMNSNCCGAGTEGQEIYEVARIKKTAGKCGLCENFAESHKDKPVAVMCCEGACLRGEVARQAANILCHSLAPEKTVRICLGGAFTKDTGQRSLVRKAQRLIAVEGCGTNCASRMMQGVIGDLKPEVVAADRLYEFNRNLFGVDEMPADEIAAHSRIVAEKILQSL